MLSIVGHTTIVDYVIIYNLFLFWTWFQIQGFNLDSFTWALLYIYMYCFIFWVFFCSIGVRNHSQLELMCLRRHERLDSISRCLRLCWWVSSTSHFHILRRIFSSTFAYLVTYQIVIYTFRHMRWSFVRIL
jgi:hypothetical protein